MPNGPWVFLSLMDQRCGPSWYLVAADDQALPPAAERQFAARMGAATVQIPSSHLAMVSHPGDVAQLIKTAAETVLSTS